MCGYRISVILQPSKLERWVRFPLPAPFKNVRNEQYKEMRNEHRNLYIISEERSDEIDVVMRS